MMRILMFLMVFIVFPYESKAHKRGNDLSQTVFKEIKSFIDTVKFKSIYNGKFNVYVIRFMGNDYAKSAKQCFTIGYIQNDYALEFIYYNYYLTIDSEFVLVYIKDDQTFNAVKSLGLTKINNDNLKVIIGKLLNTKENGEISGTSRGEVCCVENSKLTKEFYRNSGGIPKQYSIFNVDKIMGGVEIRELNPKTLEPLSKDR